MRILSRCAGTLSPGVLPTYGFHNILSPERGAGRIPDLLNTSSRRHAFSAVQALTEPIYQAAPPMRFTGSGHFAKMDRNGPNGPYVI